MDFRVLGPLEVVVDGRSAPLGGTQQRAVLAILLLRRGEVVTAERIVDELWAERPPETAVKTVQVYVSRLRKVIGGEVLATRGGGYALDLPDDQVDAARFERLAAEGRDALARGDATEAAKLLSSALELWRGRPLEDLAYQAFAQAEISRLEEVRLGALESRIDADLALGRHAAVVPELEGLVREHPTREHLRAQLMLALYRSGRQTDALESYRALQRALSDELGLEPGAELKQLERAMLNQDPELAAPAAPRTLAAVRARRRGGVLLAAGGCVLLLAAGAAVLAIEGDDPELAAANTLAVLDPGSNELETTLPTGIRPTDVVADDENVWVANRGDDTITQIDPRESAVVATRSPRTSVGGLAVGGDALWVADARYERVIRIDPLFDAGARSIRLASGPAIFGGASKSPVTADADATWAGTAEGALARIDPERNAVTERVSVGNSPVAATLDEGSVWVADETDNTVSRIDPDAANAVSGTTLVGRGPSAIAVGEGAVWVANAQDDTVSRVDPETTAVTATIEVGGRPTGIAAGEGAVWVANSLDGTVSRIDPEADEVEDTIEVGEAPHGVTVAHGRVWVTVQARAEVETPSTTPPGDVVRVLAEEDSGPTDPALDFDFPRQAATCAPLYSYANQNAALRPEAAVGEPSITKGGRRYTFRVRPGLRFSPPSDEPVTAAAYARAVERALHPRMGSYAASVMRDVKGADAYAAGRTHRIAGLRATGDRLVIELTRAAGDLPARMASPWFCPVPPDTPITPEGVDALPTSGPYFVASHTHDGLVLRRNPNYDGPRPREAREIQYRFGISPERAIDEVVAGRADYFSLDAFASEGPGSERLAELTRRFGQNSPAARAGAQLLFTEPALSMHYFAFNATRGPFADADLRRAVNYAIDRRALAANTGVGQVGRPTEQYLPPGLPGFVDVAGYPLGGPDLERARRVADGFRGSALLYTCTFPECVRHAAVLQANLKAIGIDLDVRRFPLDEMFKRIATPGEPFDIALMNWFVDYADPANFTQLFGPGGELDRLLDSPKLDRRLEAAAPLTGEARLDAYADIDRYLVEDVAAAAPFASGTENHLLSPRMGCEVFRPVYEIEFGALCVEDD
ncbi:MAG TPA: BTAD domain-containing putative transcriptional regulator [Thermoleophilaceae bacterium]|nr:BTAD domain-containing putative transcriptional regulator [Thermoleophilaceae bacterium]